MNNQFLVELQAQFDRAGLSKDFQSVRKEFEAKGIKINPVLDKASVMADMRNVAKSVQKELGNVNINVKTSDVMSSMKSIERESDVLQKKLNNIKLKIDNGSVDKSVANVTSQYNKLGSVTKDLEGDFKALNVAQYALGKSNSDEELIANYTEFSTLLSKVTNQTKTLASEQKMAVSGDMFNSDKMTFGNSIESFIKNNSKMADDSVAKLRNLQSKIGNVANGSELNSLKKQFRSVTSEIEALGQTGDNMFTKLGKNVGQLFNFMGSATILFGTINAFKSMVSEVENLDKSIVDIRQATGYSQEQAEKLMHTYIELGQQMGATGTEVEQAAASWLKQGKSIAEANTLARDSIILSKDGQIESADATRYLTSITKSYGIAVADTLSVVDKLSSVDMASATDVAGLSEAVSSVSANAQSVGISLDKILGIVATIGETSGQAMSSVGNSVDTMISRMANIKLSRLTDPESGEDLSNVETSLRNVGIELRKDDKTFNNFGDVLDNVNSKWSTYSDVTKKSIASSIAGKDHMNDFLILMNHYKTALDYTTVSQQSSGEAMEKFNAYQDSVEGKTKTLQASLESLATNTLNSDLVKGFLDVSNSLVQFTDNIGLLTVALGGIAVFAGVKTGIFKSLADQISLAMVAQTGYTVETTAAALAQVGLTGAITATGTALKAFVMSNPLLVGVTALIGGVVLIDKAIDSLVTTEEEHAEKLAEAQQAYEESAKKIQDINSELTTTQQRIDELNAKDNLSFVEQSELDKLKEQNTDLQLQLELQKEINAEKQKGVIDETVDSFNDKYNTKELNDKSVKKYEELPDSSGITNIATETDSIPAMIVAYERFIKLKNEATDSKDIQRYDESLNDVKNNLTSNLETLQKWKDTLTSVPVDQLGKDGQKALDQVNWAIENIWTTIDKQAWNDIQFKATFDDSSFSDTKTKLLELADSGKLTADTLNTNEEYKVLLTETGLSAEQCAQQINALAESNKANASATATATDATSALQELLKRFNIDNTSVNTITESVDSLVNTITSAQEAIAEKGDVASGTIADLYKAFANDSDMIASLDRFQAGLMSESELLDKLKSKYGEVTDAWQQAQVDKQNSSDTFYSAVILADKKMVDEFAKDYDIDLTNFHNVNEAHHAIFSDLSIKLQNIQDNQVESLAKKYGVDLSNFKDAQSKKIALLGAVLDTLGTVNEKASANMFTTDSMMGKDVSVFNKDAQTKLKQVYTDIVDEKKNADEAASKLDAIVSGYKPEYTSTKDTGSGNSSGKKKTGKTSTGSTKQYSQVFDWIEIRINSLKEKAQKAVDSIIKYTSYKTKNAKIDIAIKTKGDVVDELKKSEKKYNKKANQVKLPAKYRDLVDNGGLKIETIKDEKLANKIEEYKKWRDAAKEVGETISDINNEIKELQLQKLDNITSYFDSKSSTTDARISNKESEISLKEAKGESASKGDYKYLINRNKTLISNLQAEYKAYDKQFQQNIKDGAIKVGDAEWKEATSHLLELKGEINGVNTEIANLNIEVRELNWKSFDNGITKITNTKDELSDLADMISDADAVDDSGKFTKDGYAKLGLYTEQMAESQKLVSEYALGIKKIKEELKKGIITQEQYDEELANYKSLQRDAVKDIQSVENAIASLAKVRIESEIDAINKETAAFKKLVDEKKKSLDEDQEAYEWKKSVEEKTSDLKTLNKQIEVLKLSSDRKSIAQRLQLEKERNEKQKELEDAQYKHSVDVQKDALDKEYDKYEESQQVKIDALEKSLEDQEQLVKTALNDVLQNTTLVSDGIKSLATEHGISVTDSVVSPWQSATSALELYKAALESIPSTTSIGMDGYSLDDSSSSSTNGSTKKTGTGKLINGSTQTTGIAKLSSVQNSTDVLKKSNITSTQKSSLLKKLKKIKGFSSGTDKVKEDQLAWTQEKGLELITRPSDNSILTPLKAGDGILNKNLTSNLMDWGSLNPNEIFSAGRQLLPLNNIQKKQDLININYDSVLKVENMNGTNLNEVKSVVDSAINKNNSTIVTLIKQNR